MNLPLIIGISGAYGVVYGVRLIQLLNDLQVECHLVISKAAEMTLAAELDMKAKDVGKLADHVYPVSHIGAAIASGSFLTRGMVIAPCSIKTMGEIVTGVTSNLLSRAADVTLKERRRLVLMVRETPLHTGHLRSMTQASEMGAIIAPPAPAFYTRPQSIDEMVTQSAARLLDLFDIQTDPTIMKRWGVDIAL